jgi:hypothetical protein
VSWKNVFADCPPQKQSRFIHRLQALLIGRLFLLPPTRVNSSDNHLRLAAIYAMEAIDNDRNKVCCKIIFFLN